MRLREILKANIVVGLDLATILADAWAHRMQFLYDSGTAGLLDAPAAEVATMEEYAEPRELIALMLEAGDQTLILGMHTRGIRAVH